MRGLLDDEFLGDGESQAEEKQADAARAPAADEFATEEGADCPHHDFRDVDEQDAGAGGTAGPSAMKGARRIRVQMGARKRGCKAMGVAVMRRRVVCMDYFLRELASLRLTAASRNIALRFQVSFPFRIYFRLLLVPSAGSACSMARRYSLSIRLIRCTWAEAAASPVVRCSISASSSRRRCLSSRAASLGSR